MLNDRDVTSCRSILGYYRKNGGISPKQWSFAEILINNSKSPSSTQSDKKQYLYAISDGEIIKLGYTSDIKSRIKSLQTSNSKYLFLAWKYYVGRCVKKARIAECKLHRRCRDHKIRGEWFKLSCFSLVESFKVK